MASRPRSWKISSFTVCSAWCSAGGSGMCCSTSRSTISPIRWKYSRYGREGWHFTVAFSACSLRRGGLAGAPEKASCRLWILSHRWCRSDWPSDGWGIYSTRTPRACYRSALGHGVPASRQCGSAPLAALSNGARGHQLVCGSVDLLRKTATAWRCIRSLPIGLRLLPFYCRILPPARRFSRIFSARAFHGSVAESADDHYRARSVDLGLPGPATDADGRES